LIKSLFKQASTLAQLQSGPLAQDALLSAADLTSRDGLRDHALLLTLYNSGARVSEIIGVRRDEIVLGAPASGPESC
jgi:site-specific recombinase XerD